MPRSPGPFDTSTAILPMRHRPDQCGVVVAGAEVFFATGLAVFGVASGELALVPRDPLSDPPPTARAITSVVAVEGAEEPEVT